MFITTNSVVYDGEMNEYILGESVGDGGFGIVYKAIRKSDNLIFAVKTLNPYTADEDSALSFINEIKLAQQVQSQHVVHYEYAHNGTVYKELPPYIIMEFAPDGTLFKVIETARKSKSNFSIDFILSVFSQLIDGMEKLNQAIIHRDIKPQNILRFGDVYKVSDFGISKLVNESTRTLTFKGIRSKFYTAPEAWNSEKHTIQMDIYSMGIIFYEMATLQYPYIFPTNPDYNQLKLMHLTAPVNKALLSAAIPQYLVSTILLMLEKDTKKRFKTWNEIRESIRNGQNIGDPSILGHVERAMQQTNATEIAIQERKAIAQRKKDIENEYCDLLISQFYNSFYLPIQDFVDAFNDKNPTSKKMKVSYMPPNKNYTQFCSFIYTTPFNTGIEFDFEIPTLDFVGNPKTAMDSLTIDNNKLGQRPKVNNEEIIAWGVVRSSYQTGFNIVLTYNPIPESIYGNWYILKNSNSSIAHTGIRRVSPFGFNLSELPKEIYLIYATHVYSTNVLPLDIEYVFRVHI